ncbi:MAG: GTP-binding protein [Vezdaea aestivalis]|nr:MAG: GTP-binding protein [Vezdaea aestivalis]
MAAFGVTSSRRKTATYGKASRRVVNSIGTVSTFDYTHNGDGPTNSNPIAMTSTKAQSKRPHRLPLPDRPQSTAKGDLQRKVTLISKHQTENTLLVKSPQSVLHNQPQFPGTILSDRDIFDVPLSDDEKKKHSKASSEKQDVIRKVVRVNPMTDLPTRKRKRNQQYKGNDQIQEEDSELQRHIAMEVTENDSGITNFGTITPPLSLTEDPKSLENSPSAASRLPLSKQESRNSTTSDKVRKVQYEYEKRSPRLGNDQQLPRQISPRASSSTVSQLASPMQRAERVGTRTPESKALKSSRVSPRTPDASRRNYSCSPTSPMGASPGPQVPMAMTTPTQAKLWDNLIPDAALQSSGHLRMKRLTISAQLKGNVFQDNHSTRLSAKDFAPKSSGESSRTNQSDATFPVTILDSQASDSSRTYDFVVADGAAESPEASQRSLVGGRTGPKITYARQRTYLSEKSLSDEASLQLPFDLDPELPVVPAKPKRKMRKVGFSDQPSNDVLAAENNPSTGIRSIHELRRAGTIKRFVDDVESLFDDVTSSQKGSSARKRSALSAIAEKLAKEDFRQSFKSHGFEQQLYRSMASEEDTISIFLFAACLSLLFANGAETRALYIPYQTATCLALVRMFNFDKDIVSLQKEKRWNLSRVAQAQLVETSGWLQRNELWGMQLTGLSPRTLALKSLGLVSRTARNAGDQESPLSAAGFIDATAILQQLAEKEPNFTPDDRANIELVLSLLESHSSFPRNASADQSQAHILIPALTTCVSAVLDSTDAEFQNIQWLALRLVTNVTSHRDGGVAVLIKPRLVKSLATYVLRQFDALLGSIGDQDREMAINCLIMSLVSLLTLSEGSSVLKKELVSPTEIGTSLLDALLQIFVQKLETTSEAYSIEEVQFNIPFSYLAILLGDLCTDESISHQVRQALPQNTLRPLIEAIVEFLQHHRAVESQVHSSSNDDIVRDGMIAKMESLVQQLSRKSSLTVQYVDGHFVESYYPTIENTFSKPIKYKGQEYATEIVDTAGQDEYSILNSKHFIGIHGYMLVYSVASQQSLEMVRIIREKILNHLGTEWVPMVVVGNKSDLRPEQRQVTAEEGKQLAEQFKCGWTEASARYNENVSKAFELMIGEVEKAQNPSQPPAQGKCLVM